MTRDPQAEAARLRAIHSPPTGEFQLYRDGKLTPINAEPIVKDGEVVGYLVAPCDWCDDGDTPVDGWHIVYTDEYDLLGTSRVPCPRKP